MLRDADVLRDILQEEEAVKQPQTSLHIVVHEYRCPDCKHSMWAEADIAKWCECSICGFHGAFKKRED